MADIKKSWRRQQSKTRGITPTTQDFRNKYRGTQFRDQRGVYIRHAMIMRVDPELFCVDLKFLDDNTMASFVPLTSPMWAGRSGMFSFPEVGAIALCGFARWGSDFLTPYILGYVPVGAKSGIRYDKSQFNLDAKEIRSRLGGKIYPGETRVSSGQGSSFHLGKDVSFSNYDNNEFGLRADDQAILEKSVQRYTSTDAEKVYNGMCYRQDSIIKPVGTEFVLSSKHQELYIVTVDATPYDVVPPENAVPWVENRRYIEEFGDGTIAITEQHDGDARDLKEPYWRHNKHESNPYELFERIEGTNVGNEPRSEKERYGLVLVPQIWDNKEAIGDAASSQRPRLDELSYHEVEDGGAYLSDYWINELGLSPTGALEEKKRLSTVFRERMRKEKSHHWYYAVNKEGKEYKHVGMSSDIDPLGAGRSLEWCSEGSVKIVMGKNVDEGVSLQAEFRGEIKAHIGYADIPNKRIYARHLDAAAYGGHQVNSAKPDGCVVGCALSPPVVTPGHGYHADIDRTASGAPHKAVPCPSDPQNEGLSVDLNIDKNTHIIMGTDDVDGKSLVVDTKGAIIVRLGAELKNNDSIILQTDGGMEWDIGSDADNNRSLDAKFRTAVQFHICDGDVFNDRSLEAQLAKGMFWSVAAPDGTGHSLSMVLNGNVSIDVLHGDVDLSVLDGNAKVHVSKDLVANAGQNIIFNAGLNFVINAGGKILINGTDIGALLTA